MNVTSSRAPGITGPEIARTWAEMYRSFHAGLLDYSTSLVNRKATPLDVATDLFKWAGVLLEQPAPDWATQHRVIFESDVARLRDFTQPGHENSKIVPTLVLPPQAGHSSCIVDFSPKQSQIGAVLAAGLDRALVLDWVGATAATRNRGIDDYLDVIARAVDYAGGKINLIGDCQGGWLAVLYAALHPEQINTLTVAGAPIDFHAGDAAIQDWLASLAPGGQLGFYRSVVAANRGLLPGKFMLSGFIGMNPQQEISRRLDLLREVGDDGQVDRYREFDSWFRYTQDLSGVFYLWIVEHLFVNNELIAGKLELQGRTVDLADIKCPLYLMAGSIDHITPPDQVWALGDYVGTPAADITRHLTDGGHLGLFMGRDALTNHWPKILSSILGHSAPSESRDRRAVEPVVEAGPAKADTATAAKDPKPAAVKSVTAKAVAPTIHDAEHAPELPFGQEPVAAVPATKTAAVKAADAKPASKSATAKSAPAKLAAVKPAAAKPAAVKPAAVKPAAVKLAAVKPAAVKPAAVKPAAVKPAVVKLAPVKPAAVKPAPVKPAPVKPAKPAAATKRSATKPAGPSGRS